eukprot:Phypoly_transcript_00948.p1 GENE.Phypoly_transcript_00948~~Phypoly_transcript_00948.p1  ORF type:complete len:1187 (+),score=204.39 Phypoly_transcript_00948:86-3646(+)
MTKLISLLVLLQFACFALSQCPWTVAGALRWSDSATWAPNPVPALGSNVVIPSGKKVIYDVTATGITYAGVTINGGAELIFDGTKNVWMETKFINVNYNATFRIGSSSCHYPTKATIVLVGAYDATTNVVPFTGTKNVIVQGLLEWYGNPPQPTWTNIAATVYPNATQITVKDTLTNWKVGDTIALASTDYYQDLTEQFTITAISGKTLTLNTKTKYLHWGADTIEYAEVGHITRNIVITGDSQSDAKGFGGHCIVIGNGIAHVYGVEFTKMGQKGILARYPFHFHYMGDQIGKGHFVEESSFHHNYQRCLTVHATSGVLVQNNVGYNVTGHCYFLEEGSETHNTYNHNLGMVVNVGPMIPSDQTPSVFWITNPNNTFTNNVAVGGEFGFWFSLPLHPIGMSAGQTNVYPRYTPLLQFDNNLAHSADDSGIFADNGPDANGNTDEESSFTPLVGPYTSDTQTWNTAAVRATLTGNNAYKNRQHGIWFRGSQITIRNSRLQDNGVGVNMPATGNLFRDSVIIGETNNIGTPGHTQWFNDFGRSRPMLWWADFPIHGWEGYDSTGGQFCRNVVFQNFVTNSVRRAGAVGAITDGIYVLPPNDMFAQITLSNSNAFAMPDYAWGTTYDQYDGPRHVVFIDTDGTLTGAYGNAITSNGSIINIDGGCTSVLAWNKYFNCSRHPNGYSQIEVVNLDTGGTNFGSSLSQVNRATFIPFGHGTVFDNVTGGPYESTIRSEYSTNVISRKGYLLQFPHPTPHKLQVNLRFASTGEWVVVAFQYPSTTFTLTRGYSNTPLTAVTSLSLLSKSTYYYDATNQYLYVMYYEDDGSLVNNAGFPEYGYGSGYINIAAGCGTSCTVGSHAVPAAYADGEDHYQVNLKKCGGGLNTTSTHEGIGYFYFNKKTHVVTYIIYHNIATATTAQILVGGKVFQTLPVGQAPIRGAFEISWNRWNALWNGTWTVRVKSSSFSNGEIGGTIGCSGSCTAPPSISNTDPCLSVNKQMVLYSDSLNTSVGWSDWSWGSIRNYAYTADKKCGSDSLNVQFGVWGSVALHMGNGNCNPGQCTASWQVPYLSLSGYSFFQFNVKSPAGPLPTPLVVYVTNGAGASIGTTLTVTYNYIDNFVVEETWTRVKIPLTALGVQSTDLVGIFTIQMQASLSNYTVLFDDIHLVPSYSDPITRAPYGSVHNYAALTC